MNMYEELYAREKTPPLLQTAAKTARVHRETDELAAQKEYLEVGSTTAAPEKSRPPIYTFVGGGMRSPWPQSRLNSEPTPVADRRCAFVSDLSDLSEPRSRGPAS